MWGQSESLRTRQRSYERPDLFTKIPYLVEFSQRLLSSEQNLFSRPNFVVRNR